MLSENSFRPAIGKQQFIISATNTLADMLSNTLDTMEMQMQMSPSQGEGEMQLPDIIMSQEALNKQMEKELGKKGEKSNGKEPNSEKGEGVQKKGSEGTKEGDSGSKQGAQGSGGKEGKSGQNAGQNGQKGQSVQEGDSEIDTGELFEIFKKQQNLRNALQDLIEQSGLGNGSQKLLDSMEKIEQNLINQGVNKEAMQQMTALKHQLLKLEKAIQQQGEDTKRVSDTNKAERYQTPIPSDETIKEYFNSTEILNRQSLPLRLEFKKKVQDYFKTKND